MRVSLLVLMVAAFISSSAWSHERKQIVNAKEQFKRRLSRVMIPKLDFQEASLREVIDFLKKKSADLELATNRGSASALILEDAPLVGPSAPDDGNAGKNGDPLLSIGERRITVSLTHIPLFEALLYVLGLTNTKMSFRKDGVHIVDLAEPEPMFTREFRIPADFFPAFAQEDRLGQTGHVAEMKKDFAAYLASNGLTLPSGATATLNDTATRLIVKTTAEQLGSIPRILVSDRPASAFPIPGPRFPKVFEGPPGERISDWREAETEISKKLRSIRLPKVTLLNVNLYRAGMLLTKMSIQQDKASKGTKRGVLISAMILTESTGWPPTISYTARNVLLSDAVKAIAKLGDCGVAIGQRRLEWRPVIFAGQRTYLVPPSIAAQLARWPESINQNLTATWLQETGINLPPHGGDHYIAKRHQLIATGAPDRQQVIEKANENAWHEYYASFKAKEKDSAQ